jgi:fructan beta-fructosidase
MGLLKSWTNAVAIRMPYLALLLFIAACGTPKKPVLQQEAYNEPYRPQVHFSPPAHWMNDPNGMVFYKGTYHLFYQYYPDSTVWGPMHWGHATSTDLVHWQHQPIALYPDSLGYIFSGSAVVDSANTSGFGAGGKVPLVAIFTYQDPKGEKAGRNDYQYQSLAYSLDDGKTWTKYSGNPVLKNPGIKDFRDPKVMWYAPLKKWIMTLATLDRIAFYSSPNLKDWTKESEFGKGVGAHGGVWECPDLVPFDYNGETVWVLIVNLNPGGPNGGSATQYFTGQFDGHTFTPFQTDTRWLDYGPDEYAGVTWSNTGKRTIFLGWMSNWQYADLVPTVNWRSAMTVPRDLGLEKVGDKYLVVSKPVPELSRIIDQPTVFENIDARNLDLTSKTGKLNGPAQLHISSDTIQSVTIMLSNNQNERVVIGYDKPGNQYFIDRTRSGKVDFEKGFAAKHTAPRLSDKDNLDLTLIIDNASVELFADGGLSVMTSIFFPNAPFTNITLQAPDGGKLKTVQFSKLESIYNTSATAALRNR